MPVIGIGLRYFFVDVFHSKSTHKLVAHRSIGFDRMAGTILIGLLGLFLPGCTVGPDYEGPEGGVPDAWSSTKRVDLEVATDREFAAAGWWKQVEDPQLERLIREGLANNYSLEAAEFRLRRARALVGTAEARPLPTIGAGGSYTRAYLSEELPVLDGFFDRGLVQRDQELYSVTFDAAWELDFFGGDQRRVEAAEARVGRAEAGLEDARISLIAELARNYFELRRSQRQLQLLEERIESRKGLRDLAETSLETGIAAEDEWVGQKAGLAGLKGERPTLLAEGAAATYRIAVLTGGDPEEVFSRLKEPQTLPAKLDPVPVGVPGDVLRRRPDVRAAERALAEATAMVGVQIAGLYPSFALTGAVGSQAASFGDLFASQTATGWIIPTIRWNLFQGGAVRARIDAAEAEESAALADYRQTILAAVAEVETRLTQYGRSLESRRHATSVVEEQRRALELAEKAHASGVAALSRVLEAKDRLAAAEARLAAAQSRVLVALAALAKAMGGGWDSVIPDTPDNTASAPEEE